jgi:hypothetical protein
MPFVRLFPCDIVKRQSGGATFYFYKREALASSLRALALSVGGDGGRKSRERPTQFANVRTIASPNKKAA